MTTPTQPTGSTQSEPRQETPVVAPTTPLSSSLLASSSTSFSFGQNNSATSSFAQITTPTKPFTLGQTRPTTVPKVFAPIRTYAHDPTYYKNDGDCTVLVGGILFKVHRFLLTRDSSKFQASLPQSPNGGPGSSDDYPITVFSDLEEFRALCWVLYALPHETNLQNDPKHVDIPMLTSIARISRKHEFHNIERWSLDLLKLHLRPESACTFADTCSAASISSLLELSVIGKLDQLERFIVVKWLDRIRKGELEIWYALAVAERLKLRDLQG
ncbi:hypothetical protein AX16_004599 [Volvariella volvacea WC 439]|nr:hypothetical protein AX16_004599 [Volvariella volvacea WC 439]